MSKMQADLKETVTQELQMFYRMNGVMIQMMMSEAETQNIVLKNIDVKAAENYKALENMKEYENMSKLDSNFNKLNVGLSKQGGVMMNALG